MVFHLVEFAREVATVSFLLQNPAVELWVASMAGCVLHSLIDAKGPGAEDC